MMLKEDPPMPVNKYILKFLNCIWLRNNECEIVKNFDQDLDLEIIVG